MEYLPSNPPDVSFGLDFCLGGLGGRVVGVLKWPARRRDLVVVSAVVVESGLVLVIGEDSSGWMVAFKAALIIRVDCIRQTANGQRTRTSPEVTTSIRYGRENLLLVVWLVW